MDGIKEILHKYIEIKRIGEHGKFVVLNTNITTLEKELQKKLSICDVVRSLPESKDRILELEKAIVSWDLKNDINDKQAFSCGWNNCYRWIKDFVRQQR